MRRWSVLILLLAGLGLSACGANETLVLLADDDGKVGALSVKKQDGSGDEVLMNQANQVTRIDPVGTVKTAQASDAEVDKEFGAALSTLPPQSKHFILYFELASTRVTPKSQPVLVQLFEEVASRKNVEVLVTGHTDTVGYRRDNDVLAIKRAEKVKQMLLDRGLKAPYIWAAGRGERELLVETPDETAEPRNRRVEVIVR